MAGSFASGNWIAREGNEDEFVSRWLEFLRWTQENADGFSEATLIRDNSDPRHFLSFAEAGASAHPLVSGAKPTTRLSSSRPVQQLETRLDAR
jgi:hypothetical protein